MSGFMRVFKLLSLTAILLLGLEACSTSSTTPGGSSSDASGGAAWQKVIDAAKKEGSVAIYSQQTLPNLQNFGKQFEQKYGIPVTIVRLTNANASTLIQAEHDTGKNLADMWVTAVKSEIATRGQQGWFVPVVGPSFAASDFKRASNYYSPGDYFAVGDVITAIGWNTRLYPKGLRTYSDLLDPALKGGKIGIPDISPTSASFYQYLTKEYGSDFLSKLAAQKPVIYPSGPASGQAMIAGEIPVEIFDGPEVDPKANGAPVNFVVADNAWALSEFGGIFKTAPHPNAGQLLANFMLTVDGQAASMHSFMSVLPNVPGCFPRTDKTAVQVNVITPAEFTAYQTAWNKLFK
jgi:iron(III) transport system substrate-binding protein